MQLNIVKSAAFLTIVSLTGCWEETTTVSIFPNGDIYVFAYAVPPDSVESSEIEDKTTEVAQSMAAAGWSGKTDWIAQGKYASIKYTAKSNLNLLQEVLDTYQIEKANNSQFRLVIERPHTPNGRGKRNVVFLTPSWNGSRATVTLNGAEVNYVEDVGSQHQFIISLSKVGSAK